MSSNQTFRIHTPIDLARTNYTLYVGTKKDNKTNNFTCNPCAPGLVPPLPLALDEFGAQTPELHPPP